VEAASSAAAHDEAAGLHRWLGYIIDEGSDFAAWRGDGAMAETEIGRVTHYFDHISVAVLALTGAISVGDTVRFSGHAGDFEQQVTSLQIQHKEVTSAKKGDDVAIKVIQKVREQDKVYKITAA
jgi:putative protease